MSLSLEKLFTNITERDGIYYCNDDLQTKLSYPEQGYDNLLDLEEKSFWYKHRNKVIKTLINRYSPHEVLFDIGGGSGAVSHYLSQNGHKSVLIEPGFKGAFNGSRRGLPTICSNFESLSLKNKNSIHSVGLFDVIEHIEDDISFLKQLKDFVADQGLVYITVPAYQFLWSNDDIVAGHFRRYTSRELQSKLESLNYKVLYSSYLFSPLVLPVYILRALCSKFGQRKVEYQQELKEHSGDGLMAKFIQPILELEAILINKGLRVPVGTSFVIVAQNLA